jgi:hypothetical protein
MSSGMSKSIPGQLIQFVSRFEKQVIIAGAFCDAQWVRMYVYRCGCSAKLVYLINDARGWRGKK